MRDFYRKRGNGKSIENNMGSSGRLDLERMRDICNKAVAGDVGILDLDRHEHYVVRDDILAYFPGQGLSEASFAERSESRL